MAEKQIILSRPDYEKLSRLLENMKATHRLKEPHLIHLYDELQNALVMEHDEIPHGRVTLHSHVNYTNLLKGTAHEATIVFPVDKDESSCSYSILSPLGTALIGEEVDSQAICYAPAGEIPLRIDRIAHPGSS